MTAEQKAALLATMTTAVREGQSPLRCFVGKVGDIEPHFVPNRQDPSKLLNRPKFKFIEVIVCSGGSLCGNPACLGAVTPYIYPTAELEFMWPAAGEEATAGSATGILNASINKITGNPTLGIANQLQKVWHVQWTGGHAMRRIDGTTNEWVNAEGSAYEVMSIDGIKPAVDASVEVAQVAVAPAAPVAVAPVAPVAPAMVPVEAPVYIPPVAPVAAASTPAIPIVEAVAAPQVVEAIQPVTDEDNYLCDIADGKDQPSFNMAAFQDVHVQATAELYQRLSLASEPTLTALVLKGMLTIDESGVYHRAPV